jgi:L,D-transpeptidase ErfK/SrfK
VTISIGRLISGIVATFVLIALTASTSRAFLWFHSSPPEPSASQSLPTSAPTPSSSSILPPTAPVAARIAQPRATPGPLAHRIAGGEFDFIVAADGNSFTRIGSRFGVSPRILARDNGMQVTDWLKPGATIHIDNQHIVPLEAFDLIEINLPQRMLFRIEDGRLSAAYPVAIGQPSKQWRTPTGAFKVIQMRQDPTWRVPASIQREEELDGKDVEDEIEPGPDNPLGKYWIGLSFPVIGIHGTNHPISVYSYRTHGCVRLHPDDIEALFDAVDLNDRGEIVYLPLMLARLDDRRIFLESQKDIYRKGTGGIDAIKALAEASGIGSLIDWPRAEQIVNDEEGIARDVTLKSDRAGGTPAEPIAATITSDQKPSAGYQQSRGPIAAALPPH